jgi:predicted nucleic acid-binding protein
VSLVLDAGAVLEYLRGSPVGRRVGELMVADPDLDVPHLMAIEVASVLRRMVLSGGLDPSRAETALARLATLPARRWAAEGLLGRIWELRDNMTAYDAVYVALAETLGATLLTTDQRLAAAARAFSRCRVSVP